MQVSRQVMMSSRRIVYCLVLFPLSLHGRIFAVCSTVTYSGYVCLMRSRSTLVTPFYVVTVGDIVGMLYHKIDKVLFAHKVAPTEDVSG